MEMNKPIKRGDIYWIEKNEFFDCPAIVVSHETNNLYGDKVLVVPLAYSLENLLPTHCIITAGDCQYKAMCENIYTVEKSKLIPHSCSCADVEMMELENCLYTSLGLEEPPDPQEAVEWSCIQDRIHDMELNYAAEKTRADTFEKLYNELLNLCMGK